MPTSLSTCRRRNDFCAPRRNTARPIYFYAVIYIIRTSTVIRSDDIYIYIYMYIYIYIYIFAVISISSQRHGTAIFGAAQASQGQGPSAMLSFFLFFVFCFFLTVVCEQGLKGYPPHTTLITTGHPTNYILAPPPCRKSWAMTIWSKF